MIPISNFVRSKLTEKVIYSNVLYGVDSPLTFTMKLQEGIELICCKVSSKESISTFICAPVNTKTITKLVEGKVSFYDSLDQGWVWVLDADINGKVVECVITQLDNISKRYLPVQGLALYEEHGVVGKTPAKKYNPTSINFYFDGVEMDAAYTPATTYISAVSGVQSAVRSAAVAFDEQFADTSSGDLDVLVDPFDDNQMKISVGGISLREGIRKTLDPVSNANWSINKLIIGLREMNDLYRSNASSNYALSELQRSAVRIAGPILPGYSPDFRQIRIEVGGADGNHISIDKEEGKFMRTSVRNANPEVNDKELRIIGLNQSASTFIGRSTEVHDVKYTCKIDFEEFKKLEMNDIVRVWGILTPRKKRDFISVQTLIRRPG